jgi:hypothetical protein
MPSEPKTISKLSVNFVSRISEPYAGQCYSSARTWVSSSTTDDDAGEQADWSRATAAGSYRGGVRR